MSFTLIFSRKAFLIFQAKKIVTISCSCFDKSIELKKRCKDENENKKEAKIETTLIEICKVEKTLFVVLIIVTKYDEEENENRRRRRRVENRRRTSENDEKSDRDRRLFMRLFILFMLFIIFCFISYFIFFSIILLNCCMTFLISMISFLSSLRLCCRMNFLNNELIDF